MKISVGQLDRQSASLLCLSNEFVTQYVGDDEGRIPSLLTLIVQRTAKKGDAYRCSGAFGGQLKSYIHKTLIVAVETRLVSAAYVKAGECVHMQAGIEGSELAICSTTLEHFCLD